MTRNDVESVATGASSTLLSRNRTIATSNSSTTGKNELRRKPQRGSISTISNNNAKKGGIQRNDRSHGSGKQFVPPRIVVNGKDVTPLPLSSSWTLPGENMNIDVDDVVSVKEELLCNGMLIPWMHEDYDMVIDGNGGAAKAAFDFPERTRRVQIELESDTKRTDDSSIWSTVTLRETPTMEMFHLPGSIVTSVREELLKKTKNKNKQYQENKMKKSLMQNRDRSVQTFHNAQKNKQTMTDSLPSQDAECYANFCGTGNDKLFQTEMTLFSADAQERHLMTLAATMSNGCLIDVSDGEHNHGSSERFLQPVSFTSLESVKAYLKKDRIIRSNSLLTRLRWMEETLLRDKYHKQHLRYRGLPVGLEAEIIHSSDAAQDSLELSKVGSILDHLLTYTCNLCKQQKVTSMDWNRSNEDILAVGYKLDTSSDENVLSRGMVLLWSLCNPNCPQNTIFVDSGVTCLTFSSALPCMLSVGTENGNILLYDIYSSQQSQQRSMLHPIADSAEVYGSNHSAIWQLKWISKKASGEGKSSESKRTNHEYLVSVGSDGRVVEWSTEKGLSLSCTLMQFKHANRHPECIFETTGALCIDFLPQLSNNSNDEDISHDSSSSLSPSTYFVGTEDGRIHRCSYTYMEQPLETYSGHSGPVYHIRCSPLLPDVFLSCSADWAVKVWRRNADATKVKSQGTFVEEKSFRPLDLLDAINDVAWSNTIPTIFASVSEDGRLQLYDVAKSTSEPVQTVFSNGVDSRMGEVSVRDERGNHLKENDEPIGQLEPTFARVPTKKVTRRPAFTCISFNRKSPILVVGDTIGNVFVYKYN